MITIVPSTNDDIIFLSFDVSISWLLGAHQKKKENNMMSSFLSFLKRENKKKKMMKNDYHKF